MDNLILKGQAALVDHLIDTHPELVVEHLLNHESTIPTCQLCIDAHEAIMRGQAEQN